MPASAVVHAQMSTPALWARTRRLAVDVDPLNVRGLTHVERLGAWNELQRALEELYRRSLQLQLV